MLFRVLGELDIISSEGDRTIARGKRMELLAILLLRANETVPLDQIIEGIWESRPPKSATRNVRTYAWHIRSYLGQEANRLAATPGGYFISCAPEELDLSIFQRLAEDASRAANRGDNRLASEKYRQALALWRGNPFGGANLSQYLRAEVDWMIERRLSVFEELMDVFAAEGAYQEIIEKVGREVIRYPLRESLHEKIMKAFFHSGRHGDALAAFHKARKAFGAELGIEPGASMKELYEKILASSR